MHVRLVRRIEDKRILRRLENPVQGDGQFYYAKIRAQVSSGSGDLLNQEVANLACQIFESF